MDPPDAVFKAGVHEVTGDCWNARVHVPRDWTLREFAAAVGPLARRIDAPEGKGGAR